MGQHFLIIVDAHSKWPEVIPMTVTTAERTVIGIRKIFAVHKLPTDGPDDATRVKGHHSDQGRIPG